MFDALAEFAVAHGQFVGALLQFAKQPRILDRDDRLVGKGPHQFDLSLGERLDPLAETYRELQARTRDLEESLNTRPRPATCSTSSAARPPMCSRCWTQ